MRADVAAWLVSRAVAAPGAPTGSSLHAGLSPPSHRHRSRRRRRSLGTFALVLLAYVAISIVLWWQVWSTHPTNSTICGCGDTSLFLWYLEWPAYALVHGHSPLFSTALFHPTGTNLLSNTSVLALGVPLIPVTLLWGPVATFNVASTLVPALTALAMFWLLRRWVRWTPAAFVGGLLFALSPFAFVALAGGHLMLSALALLPLMAGCLDELLLSQRRSPYRVGAVLGLLVVVQFFLGTEMLLIVVASALLGIALLAVYGLAVDRAQVARRAPDALRGLAVAAVVSFVALAYPLWFVLRGPAHLSGLIWPTLPPGAGGAVLSNIWDLHYQTALATGMHTWGGYLGAPLPDPEYLGIGLLVVLAAGLVVWRRDRRLWFFGALGLGVAVISLGDRVPWAALVHVPIVQNLIPGRFAAVTAFCAAALLAIVIDRTRHASVTVARDLLTRWRGHVAGFVTSAVGALVALAVAALALVPVMSSLATNVPLTTVPVVLPEWFAQVGPHLPAGEVVLAYPAPFSLVESAESWQAVDELQFAMAGGAGPGGVLLRAGKERAGQTVINGVSLSLYGTPTITPGDVGAVREALHGWGVTTIVLPDPAGLPPYDQGDHPSEALGLFTLAVGRKPEFQHDAWVWTDVQTPSPLVTVSESDFARCTDTEHWSSPSRQAVPDCLLGGAS